MKPSDPRDFHSMNMVVKSEC